MSVRVFYDILNQKGTPAMYTDTLANRPTYGFAGRLFISTDSGQIFEDTGSAWTLVADAGVGGGTLSSVCLNGNTTATGIVITAGGLSSNSITNTGNTAGSVLFAGTSGLESQSNSTFFWDNTNKRLGIGTNSPGAPLDIHGTGTNATFNGTGSSNAYLVFQNAGVSKWRIGNTYNAGANSFDIYNNGLTNTPFSINSSTNAITLSANVTTTGIQNVQNGLNLGYASGGATASYTNIYGSTNGVNFALANGTGGANFIFQTLAGYNYTFPATTGTLALTSDLSSYLPLTGGTLTGPLILSNVASGGYGIQINNSLGAGFVALRESDDSYTLGMTSPTFTTITLHANNSPSYINTTGNFGFGTASPLSKLQVVSALGTIMRIGEASGTTGKQMLFGIDATTGRGEIQAVWQGTANTPLGLNVAGGNVLVGTTTDAGYKLDVSGTIRSNVNGSSFGTASATGRAIIIQAGSGNQAILFKNAAGGDGTLYATGTSTSLNYSFNTYSVGDAFVIGNSGVVNVANILEVGTTGLNGKFNIYSGFTSKVGIDMRDSDDASNAYFLYFRKASGGNIGSIQRAGLTDAVLYNTTSDYRLKEDFKQINGLEKLSLIKVYDFKWKGLENRMDGVIAHELQKILPYAVSGIKDGTDYQGVDYSKLVPIMIKAIQELNNKLVKNNIN